MPLSEADQRAFKDLETSFYEGGTYDRQPSAQLAVKKSRLATLSYLAGRRTRIFKEWFGNQLVLIFNQLWGSQVFRYLLVLMIGILLGVVGLHPLTDLVGHCASSVQEWLRELAGPGSKFRFWQ